MVQVGLLKNINYCLQISSEMQCIFKKYTPTWNLLSHVHWWYMEIKIQPISKEVLRFYGNSTVQNFQNVQKDY